VVGRDEIVIYHGREVNKNQATTTSIIAFGVHGNPSEGLLYLASGTGKASLDACCKCIYIYVFPP